jgi:hypothetical protein
MKNTQPKVYLSTLGITLTYNCMFFKIHISVFARHLKCSQVFLEQRIEMSLFDCYTPIAAESAQPYR